MEELEKQALVYEITERILLRMPEVIGNLIQEHSVLLKLNKEFQTKYPEFKAHLPLVRSIVENTELKNPGLSYMDILEKAVPEIREKIRLKDSVKAIEFSAGSNGLL